MSSRFLPIAMLCAFCAVMPLPASAQQQPPPLPTPALVVYYVAVNGQQTGPFEMDKLKELVTAGQLKPSSLIWRAGMTEWAAAETIAEVNLLFAATPPAVPFDCVGVALGTWERVEMIGGAQLTTRVRYETGGIMTGAQISNGLSASFTGTWTGVAVGDKACNYSLTATFANGFPGGTSSAVYDIVDRNTMQQRGSTATIRRIQ